MPRPLEFLLVNAVAATVGLILLPLALLRGLAPAPLPVRARRRP